CPTVPGPCIPGALAGEDIVRSASTGTTQRCRARRKRPGPPSPVAGGNKTPTIILTNASSANPWRRISNVKQTTSNTWNGVNSAGVNAAWLAEGTIVTDNSPTVANIVRTPAQAAAWVFGSYEVLEDTDFGQQLPALLADA